MGSTSTLFGYDGHLISILGEPQHGQEGVRGDNARVPRDSETLRASAAACILDRAWCRMLPTLKEDPSYQYSAVARRSAIAPRSFVPLHTRGKPDRRVGSVAREPGFFPELQATSSRVEPGGTILDRVAAWSRTPGSHLVSGKNPGSARDHCQRADGFASV